MVLQPTTNSIKPNVPVQNVNLLNSMDGILGTPLVIEYDNGIIIDLINDTVTIPSTVSQNLKTNIITIVNHPSNVYNGTPMTII